LTVCRFDTAHERSSIMNVGSIVASLLLASLQSSSPPSVPAPARSYVVTHTGQRQCYDDGGKVIHPGKGEPFFGQDADFVTSPMQFKDLGDGSVRDEQTGLIWTKVPIECTYRQAKAKAVECRVAGQSDWRLPTIKELYSLMDFRGGSGFSPMQPYIDTSVFEFHFGDERKGLRAIDAQYWSSTEYVGLTMNNEPTVFGVNFADGRIKGYPRDRHPVEGEMVRWARFVRGNPVYGENQFVDHGDGTVTDKATGLMWAKADSAKGMAWKDALAYAQASRLAGHDDWRLPNAKELQSIVDYSRAPDAADPQRRSAAIDPIFSITDAESYFWSSTTHFEAPGTLLGTQAVYVCFGRSLGKLPPPPPGAPEPRGPKPPEVRNGFINVHGAGAQRSDPKSGDPNDPKYRNGFGPQGDDIRINNFVRLVRTS
jgi:hypothetical protein